MTQIKIFKEVSNSALEEKVNQWFAENLDVQVVDHQHNPTGPPTVSILYRTAKKLDKLLS